MGGGKVRVSLKRFRYIGIGPLEISDCHQGLGIKAQDIGVTGMLSQALIAQLIGQLRFPLPEMLQCLIKNSLGALGLADGTPRTVFIFAK